MTESRKSSATTDQGCRAYLAENLGGGWVPSDRGGFPSGETLRLSDGAEAHLELFEEGKHLTLMNINVPPDRRGAGTGSRIMRELFAYCTETGKELSVDEIENPQFFERFEELILDPVNEEENLFAGWYLPETY